MDDEEISPTDTRSSRDPSRPGAVGPRTGTQFNFPPPSSRRPSKSQPGDSSKPKRKDKDKDDPGRWLHKMTGWLTLTEPSNDALKHHRREVFRKAGLSMNDPEASTRLHGPIGTIPDDAIKPAGPGPDPEDVYRRQREERKKKRQPHRSSVSGSCVSQSSSNRSTKSNRVDNPIFPFD